MAALAMEPPPAPPHRLPLTCDRHPSESFTGFCPSCLRERLLSLESSATATAATTHRNFTSTISSSLKSIFFNKPLNPAFSSSLQPELRRCKSFSCSRLRLSSSGFEPQRRSCDARGGGGRHTLWSLFNQETFNGGHAAAAAAAEILSDRGEIAAASAVEAVKLEAMPMKDLIDLESQAAKRPATSFWFAASLFSKKLQKWRTRTKQKMKKAKQQQQQQEEEDKAAKSSSRRFRETQSEVAVDAFGRRSCDLGPRFSLDAGRVSIDDPRCSFDEPRASWDGYSIGGGGGRSALPRPMPMLSVVEDVPTPAVQRSDGQIPVEEDLAVPGGSRQTKEYYSDSLSRSRRRSLDRSSSVKKLSMQMSEAKPAVLSNAKVSPASTAEFLRDWSSHSLRDDRSESLESAFREDSSHKLPTRKKSRRWSIWGLLHRRRGDNVVERSSSATWPELQVNGYGNGYHANGRILRSNSNVSLRSTREKSLMMSNSIGRKGSDGFVLERSGSATYSTSGHGMLRLYSSPLRGSQRGLGMSRPNNNSCHSFTRSVLGFY